MYTLRFFVPALRPDFARFDTYTEAAGAAWRLINTIHAGRPIRVNITRAQDCLFSFERK